MPARRGLWSTQHYSPERTDKWNELAEYQCSHIYKRQYKCKYQYKYKCTKATRLARIRAMLHSLISCLEQSLLTNFSLSQQLCRAIKSSNQIRQVPSEWQEEGTCLIRLEELIARLSAMNLAKSLIESEKNYFNHRAPMQWNGSFSPEIRLILTFRQHRSIQYSTAKHAIQL
jgi:hypothetical protein